MEYIDHISIEKLFWFRFQKHQVNFGFKGKLEDVHFTIAFNKNSDYVNLHFTKNTPNVAFELKPRIDILYISKKDLQEFSEQLPSRIFYSVFEPFDIEGFKAQYQDIAFLSHDAFKEQDSYNTVQAHLEEGFRNHASKYRKSRIKVRFSVFDVLKELASSSAVQEHILSSYIELPQTFEKQTEAGMLITTDGVVHIIRDGNKWLKMREDVRLIHLLESILNPVLAKKIVSYSRRSLVLLRRSNTIGEISKFNNPIYLYRTKTYVP